MGGERINQGRSGIGSESVDHIHETGGGRGTACRDGTRDGGHDRSGAGGLRAEQDG